LQPPQPTRENVALKRYADKVDDPKSKPLFQFPTGQPYRIVNNGELFRIQRWSLGEDRWAEVRRSKSFIKDKFFPPFDLKESNLRKLLIDPSAKDSYSKSTDTEEYV
jgi:hypothetical protein